MVELTIGESCPTSDKKLYNNYFVIYDEFINLFMESEATFCDSTRETEKQQNSIPF